MSPWDSEIRQPARLSSDQLAGRIAGTLAGQGLLSHPDEIYRTIALITAELDACKAGREY